MEIKQKVHFKKSGNSKKETIEGRTLLQLSARHEAGHAVMCEVLGYPVISVYLNNDSTGSCAFTLKEKFSEFNLSELENLYLIKVAGHIALSWFDENLYDNWPEYGAYDDISQGVDIGVKLFGGNEEEYEKGISRLWDRATQILSAPSTRTKIRLVTQRILESRYLTGRQVRNMLKKTA